MAWSPALITLGMPRTTVHTHGTCRPADYFLAAGDTIFRDTEILQLTGGVELTICYRDDEVVHVAWDTPRLTVRGLGVGDPLHQAASTDRQPWRYRGHAWKLDLGNHVAACISANVPEAEVLGTPIMWFEIWDCGPGRE